MGESGSSASRPQCARPEQLHTPLGSHGIRIGARPLRSTARCPISPRPVMHSTSARGGGKPGERWCEEILRSRRPELRQLRPSKRGGRHLSASRSTGLYLACAQLREVEGEGEEGGGGGSEPSPSPPWLSFPLL